jgi:fatty acid desaturase
MISPSIQTRGQLSPAQLDALQAEIDAIGTELRADIGERDARYIRRVVRFALWSAITGRSLLMFGFGPISFIAGVVLLTIPKIMAVMEIGHNIIHGQYDWMNDPRLDSRTFEWDTACTSANWKHSHNVVHHDHTNVVGLDRDLGYGVLRVCGEQKWVPRHRAQPMIYLTMILIFEFGIGVYDAELDALRERRISLKEFGARLVPFRKKLVVQLSKDYLLFPLLALLTGNSLRVLLGNLIANLLRQAWTNIIIFCGHFTRRVRIYRTDELVGETRGGWYARQIEGSSNIEGSRAFCILTGHLSHQIEHHLFPDIPAHRYPEIAPRIREISERYGLVYNTGSLLSQYSGVLARLLRYSQKPRELAIG